jgi:hypothetical protein
LKLRLRSRGYERRIFPTLPYKSTMFRMGCKDRWNLSKDLFRHGFRFAKHTDCTVNSLRVISHRHTQTDTDGEDRFELYGDPDDKK